MKQYFKDIQESVTSIFEGMSISFSHLFRKPVTIQYPNKGASFEPETDKRFEETLPDRFRGFLKVDMEICTGCLACMNDCPIDCILIKMEKDPETKTRYLTQFDIDEAKCMYCGLCTDPCPTGAIHFTKEFQLATEKIEDLIFKFIPEGEKSVPFKMPRREKADVPTPPPASKEGVTA